MTLDTAKQEAALLLDVLMAHGVREAVCSPGSRNTPLILAADARESLKKHVVIDERCAAFIALGIAIATRRPVALICTSGTAMLNYAPAIAEAYYQGIPLIVITADRPLEWIDQDDSQTIRQADAFRNFIKRSYDITADRNEDDYRWYVERIANEGMLAACDRKPGPVHFNIRLAPPLGALAPSPALPKKIECLLPDGHYDSSAIERLADMASGKKVLLVAGFMLPDKATAEAVARLTARPEVAVMAETVSNLGLPYWAHAVDSTISSMTAEDMNGALAPDIVISIGGALISRRLKEWLRSIDGLSHWCVGNADVLADCFKALSLNVKGNPADFIGQLADAMERKALAADSPSSAPGYGERMRDRQSDPANHCRKIVRQTDEWCDLAAYREILKAIPEDCDLFLSNGTSVRYAQILDYTPPRGNFCNRGTSGIDGCTSTALGSAIANPDRITVLVTGDMSFAYDIGALGTRLAPDSMRIIVIDNSGGGIFRFIPSTASLPQREKYFCANPQIRVRELAVAYGWEYAIVYDIDKLRDMLETMFLPSAHPRILMVCTPPEESADILREALAAPSLPDHSAKQDTTN